MTNDWKNFEMNRRGDNFIDSQLKNFNIEIKFLKLIGCQFDVLV